jgi:DNA replication protein DnaC
MNPMPELITHLKQLRLSGFLESLETRNRQAIESKLAYSEFLALLVQDEIARRDNKKLASRLRRASFRSEKTIPSFEFDRHPELNRSLVQDLATGSFIREKVPVLIAGPVGTGKSHLAQALGHSAVQLGHEVLFISQAQLVASLHAARATGSYEKRLQAFAQIELLIIDEFALKPLRPPHDEDFHELIAERYERLPIVVTSNLDPEEWIEAFPTNRMLGAATVDRLRHGAYRIVLDGPSYREPKAEAQGQRARRSRSMTDTASVA